MTAAHRPALLAFAFALLMAMLLWPSSAQANVGCNGTGNISFGTAQAATGAINYTCNNYGGAAVNLTLCSLRGPASYPGTEAQPAMGNGGSQLNFNLYTAAARTQVWNTTTPISTGTISIPAGGVATGSISFYGYIPGGQTAPPGTYQAWFHNTVIGFLVGGTCQTNYSDWSGVQISLTASATVVNACTLSAGATSNISFGAVPSTATNRSATNQIAVTCPNGTAYYVGLRPSNGSTTGAGVMSGTGSNAAKVPYQLRSGSAAGPVWGNTATSTSVGNGVSGTGNGASRSIPIYATLPGANYPADTYADTVTVTVNY